MPPKVPSPAQYPRSTVTPPNPQMMPPQTIVHAQQPPQHVIQAHTPHQGYKPQAHPQSAPHTPAQVPMHPHPAPPQSSVTQGSQEPVTVTEPSQPGNATVAAPVQDVPGQSPSVAPEAKAEKTEESVVPVPSGEKVKVSHPQDVPVVQDAPKETVAEPSSTVIETESEERSSDVKQNTESAESKDSAEKDTKTVDATKDVGLAASANEGEKAPPVPKPEATQSAVVSEKLEKRTTPPGDSVSTTAPPPVTAEVKPVTSPPPETDTAATSQTGSSADAGEVSVEGKVTLPEETEVTEPAKSAVAVISSEVTERKEDREAVSEVKAVAKAKNKVRAKELNAKGETKQGSDMDLFLPDAPAKKADVDSAGSSGVEPEPIEEAQDKEPATPVHSSPPPTIMTSEEGKEVKIEKAEVPVDNRVVEENQKNEVKTNESSNGPTSTPASAQELKYQYKEDQWSPLNPEGKKCYDRAFLLELQYSTESVTKPEGLPHLPDVILDEPHSKKSNRSYDQSYHQSRTGSFDFTPGFVKPSPRGGSSSMGGGGGKNRSQQGRKEVKKITSVSIQQDIKLHKAENAWKPAQSVSKDDKSSDKAKTDDLYRRVTSILNKLTPQKFSTLLQQMTGLKIDTEERLKGVIDLIFEKAVSEPGFCVAYANMCKYLMLLKVPLEGKPGETVNFRKLLLNRCQREFQKDNREEIEYNNRIKEIEQAEESLRPQMMEELEIASTKARRRSLGNIRFIGELFKLKMLTENIMHECVLKLLKSHDEESLECLCRLLTTIGKELDTDKAKPRVDQYFQQMTKIVAQRKTSSRVRFMLQDVIDLRQNRWVPRRDENNPKTIDQIHKEVAQEAQEKAILIQQISSQPMHRGGRGGRGDRDRGGRPQGGGNMGEDGWSTVGVRAARATIDPTKLKLSKPQHVDENIQLGPGTRFASWGRGSSAGGTKSQEADRSSNPGNRFSALSSRGEDSHDPRSRGRGRGISPARSDMRSRNSSSRDPPRSKQGPRSSMEMERQSALATAKSYSASGRNTPPSREDSRENSRSREPRREEKPVSAPPPDMSDEEVEKKTKAIMDEYLHIQDSKEAEMCISELRSPENIYRFVAAALNHVIERSDVARRQTGNLLHDVVKKKLISVDCYVKGLGKVLEYAEDMEIDIPKIWTYLGELIGPMVQDGSVPLNFLKQVCDPLKQSNKAGVLVSEVLHDAAHRLGHLKVGELWKASSLVWTDFVPESDVKQFIKDKKLEFTLAEEAQPRSASVSSENIQSELERLLLTQNSDNEEVFDWIEGNVDEENVKSPQFIRCLMSLVCRSAIKGSAPACKVDETIIKKRGVLLQKYLDHQAELELQALYALQTLANKLEYPQGLLRSFFEILYDEDIISEDAFYQWEASKDAGEQEGKGVALKQVVQFFTWLGETEDESQEDS
ncbi:eukaryotic translation initiation factor 4 gamma 1-like isoform X2 [Liolophura sinensis]